MTLAEIHSLIEGEVQIMRAMTPGDGSAPSGDGEFGTASDLLNLAAAAAMR